jgi:D-glycero-D-manno-heptose 1,7-bisphosphate phosphatase
MRPAIFLDRDGVIIENRKEHVRTWSDVAFLDGVFDAMLRLAHTASAIVVVSNQGAVGRGIITEDDAWTIHRRIVAQIESHGGRVDASYLCTHHPDDGCSCRKPAPGMLYQAAQELELDLSRSWLVGDAVTDLEAAKAAKVRGILVRTGRGADQELLLPPGADSQCPVVDDLASAIQYISEHTL